METKADCDKYFVENKVPTTFFMLPFYWDNFCGMSAAYKLDDTTYTHYMNLGKSALSGIAVEDIGKVVNNIFKNPDLLIDKSIYIASEFLTAE